jgi:hypothetical protein
MSDYLQLCYCSFTYPVTGCRYHNSCVVHVEVSGVFNGFDPMLRSRVPSLRVHRVFGTRRPTSIIIPTTVTTMSDDQEHKEDVKPKLTIQVQFQDQGKLPYEY